MKILTVFGTRPEAIKLAPVIIQLQNDRRIDHKILLTGQHREMLDQVMNLFDLKADFDLNVVKSRPDLSQLTSQIITKAKNIYVKIKPDLILVHGDTTTAFAASLAAFYCKIPIAHVEAGLRTHNLSSPWPEELNRKLIATMADLHFAPTHAAKLNLLSENINKSCVFVTGNTVIDSLLHIKDLLDKRIIEFDDEDLKSIDEEKDPIILVTLHRRENLGVNLKNICKALKNIALRGRVRIIIPVHKNPLVREVIYKILGNVSTVSLIEPMEYKNFVDLMDKSYLIVTDSGGIQEEAPSIGKPVLVVRNTTERPEAIEAGTVRLVGTKTANIETEVEKLLKNRAAYLQMSGASNPYGDGTAAAKIKSILLEWYYNK